MSRARVLDTDLNKRETERGGEMETGRMDTKIHNLDVRFIHLMYSLPTLLFSSSQSAWLCSAVLRLVCKCVQAIMCISRIEFIITYLLHVFHSSETTLWMS